MWGSPRRAGRARTESVTIEAIFPQTVFYLFGVGIKDTVLQTFIVVVVLLGLAAWTRKKYRVWEPGTGQLTVEYVIEYVESLLVDIGGRALPEAVPYLTTMISFIVLANLLGLLPVFRAPTRDLNTTLALALVSLGSTHFYSISKRGFLGYLRSFIEPVAFMLPLNIMSQVSRTLSMALRLFGNVMAGEIISGVMFMLVPLFSPLIMNLLGMITGVLQALVFTVLTLVFVIDALGSEAETAPISQSSTQTT